MITSTQNSKLKRIARLLKNSKDRRQEGVFIIEGPKMVAEAIKHELVTEIYLAESHSMQQDREKWNVPVEFVKDEVFRTLSDTKSPQGILAVVKMQSYDREVLLGGEGPARYLVLENIQDPGNLGTLMRTAEGAGIRAVILSQGTVDIYNPKVVRSTMGSLFRIPFWYERDLCELLRLMKQRGIVTYAADLQGNRNYYEEELNSRMAVLVGNEANGLTSETLQQVMIRVKLPMEGKLESLNASVAGALLMYEAYRQLTNVTR